MGLLFLLKIKRKSGIPDFLKRPKRLGFRTENGITRLSYSRFAQSLRPCRANCEAHVPTITRNSRNRYTASQQILKRTPPAGKKKLLVLSNMDFLKRAEKNGFENGKWHNSALIQPFCAKIVRVILTFRGACAYKP